MARFESSATAEARIDRPSEAVWSFVHRLPEAFAVFPLVAEAHAREDGAHLLWLGPFGVGRYKGTVRLALRCAVEPGRALAFESIPGEGNTDARVTLALEPDGDETCVRATIWASPRREVPSFVPIALVEAVARRTLRHGLEDAMHRLRAAVEAGAMPRAVAGA